MSVLILKPNEYLGIAESFKHGELRDYFFSSLEKMEAEYWVEHAKISLWDFTDNAISTWVDRLYIANQLAFFYSYDKSIQLERLKESDWGLPLTSRVLLEKLASVRYNVITNGGNCFVSEKDMDRLERLIEIVKDIRMRELEEESQEQAKPSDQLKKIIA